MAGHDWEDWFEREELIGQISDIRVQNLQVEREVVQKRTFTRWMNLHLEKCDPPLQVQDLFQDIQDGHVLMALLEELSGCRLLHSFKKSSHRIFRLNNIAKVLSFLEERNVKLVSIDAADVADGNSSIILGLIWNIILFFQIKELTGNIRSQFPSSSSLSSIPTSSESDASLSSTPSEEKPSAATAMRENSKAIKKLLQWVQRRTRRYGVAVQDFGKSWTSGLAFLAIIKSIDSSLVDMRKSLLRSSRENLEDAFRIAHYSLGIPRLLEPEDVTINTPDEQSIIMYVSQFLEHFPGVQETEEPNQVIERSVSMGRLNFRDGDLDHVRNGADRSRVRQRAEMFQRDSTQPPPKVLISSVSEDRGILLPRLKVAAPRAWSSEDFLTDSTHMGDIPNREDVKDQTTEVLKDSPQQTFTHSPPSVPESLIGDSAINSPDSWVESELMPERFSESRSESSLWDSETTWDVYRATPVEVTPVDEGFISIEDRVPDGQSMTESYVDEGISSMDSNQDQIYRQNQQTQEMGVKKQEPLKKFNMDLVTDLTPDQEESNFTKQNGTQQMDATSPQKDKEPSVTLGSSGHEDLFRTGSLNQFKSNIPSSLEGVEESPLKDHDGKNNIQHESLEQRLNSKGQKPGSPPEDERKDSRNKSEGLNESTDVTVGEQKELLRNSSYCEESISETLEDLCSTNKEGMSKTGLNIPLISITSEPEEEDQEPDPGPGGPEQGEYEDLSNESDSEIQSPHSLDGLNHNKDKVPLESPSNMNPENIKLMSGTEDWHLDDGPLDSCGTRSEDDKDEGDANQKECSAGDLYLKETDFPDTQNQPTGPDKENRGPSRGGQDRLTSTSTEPGTQNTQKDTPDPFNTQRDIIDPSSLKQNSLVGTPYSDSASVSRNVDHFYSDFDGKSLTEDLVGDPVEPMDLFYPDKEEPMMPEPSDAELQRWPSVLSVSALQPAPASDESEDQQLDLLGGDFMTGEDQDDKMNRTGQNHADLSQDQCVLCGVMIGTATGNRESSLRSGRDEVQIAPVLRHRKGSGPPESMDRWRPAPRSAEDQDSGLWWRENRELCVVLLLWLLLYSIMLLKEMDLNAPPGLLLHLTP